MRTLIHPKIEIFTSQVSDRNMSFRYDVESKVRANKDRFFRLIDQDPDKAITCSLEHGTKLVSAESVSSKIDETIADGLWTSSNELSVYILTADCLPIVLFDYRRLLLALLHVGWRGVDNNFVNSAIAELSALEGISADNLIVYIGPYIQTDSYQHTDVSQRNDPRWEEFIHATEKGYKIDLGGMVVKQFLKAGVMYKNIVQSQIDTFSSPLFYSHVREKQLNNPQGRFITLARIVC